MPFHKTGLVSRFNLANPDAKPPVKTTFERVLKHNPNHDAKGRFSSGKGGGSYQRGDKVVVTGGGHKVQAHHSSPTRVMIPGGTQGQYVRPAGDDWHIVDTGHYESARVRGDQLRPSGLQSSGGLYDFKAPPKNPGETSNAYVERVNEAYDKGQDAAFAAHEQRNNPVAMPNVGGTNVRDPHFERGGPLGKGYKPALNPAKPSVQQLSGVTETRDFKTGTHYQGPSGHYSVTTYLGHGGKHTIVKHLPNGGTLEISHHASMSSALSRAKTYAAKGH